MAATILRRPSCGRRADRRAGAGRDLWACACGDQSRRTSTMRWPLPTTRSMALPELSTQLTREAEPGARRVSGRQSVSESQMHRSDGWSAPFGGFNMSGTDSKAGGPDYLTLFTQAKSVAEKLGRGFAGGGGAGTADGAVDAGPASSWQMSFVRTEMSIAHVRTTSISYCFSGKRP